MFICASHPQGTDAFLNSHVSYVFTLGDVDERIRNGKVLCIPDLDLQFPNTQRDLEFDATFLFLREQTKL